MEHIIEIEVVADEVQSIVVVEESEPSAAPGRLSESQRNAHGR